MYQALYRKYRPRTFQDVAGQQHVTETLRRQVANGRLSHAYLFVGTRGTGKTTCAKILARAINCVSPVDGDPCNACASCKGVENGSILDVLELDAASNNGVDNIRILREEAVYSPASVRMRVYIIDEVHMLSTAAFNALLKILEEPPEHLLFILATTELHKVPATILSRCQRFSFKRISPEIIAARLRFVAENEGLSLTEEAAAALSALADGSMRDALSLLDQCASDTVVDLPRVQGMIGLAVRQEVFSLIGAVADKNTPGALDILDRLYRDGRDMVSLLNELSSCIRDLLIFGLSPGSSMISGSSGASELSNLSKKLTAPQLFSWLDVIRETVFSLSRGGSAKLSTELCVIRMCDERLSGDFAALSSRVARLENGAVFAPRGAQPTSAEAVIAEPASAEAASAEPASVGPANIKPPDSEPVGPEPADSESVSEDPQKAEQINEEPLIEDSVDIEAATIKLDSAETDTQSEEPAPAAPTPTLEIADAQPDATPHSKLQTPNSAEGDFWLNILELLKSDIPVYAALSNAGQIRAELLDDALVIRAVNPVTVVQLESKMFSVAIREAAEKALGREIVIRAELAESEGKAGQYEKLKQLSAFDVFKIESKGES